MSKFMKCSYNSTVDHIQTFYKYRISSVCIQTEYNCFRMTDHKFYFKTVSYWNPDTISVSAFSNYGCAALPTLEPLPHHIN